MSKHKDLTVTEVFDLCAEYMNQEHLDFVKKKPMNLQPIYTKTKNVNRDNHILFILFK